MWIRRGFRAVGVGGQTGCTRQWNQKSQTRKEVHSRKGGHQQGFQLKRRVRPSGQRGSACTVRVRRGQRAAARRGRHYTSVSSTGRGCQQHRSTPRGSAVHSTPSYRHARFYNWRGQMCHVYWLGRLTSSFYAFSIG